MLYFILQDKTLNFRVTCFYGCTHMDRDTHVRECTGTHRWMQRWAILLKWKAVASLNTRQLSLMWINWYGKNRSSAVWVFVHWLYHAILTSFYFFFLGNDGTFCFASYYYWVNCQSLRVSKALKIIWCWMKDKQRYSTSSSSSTFIFLSDVGPRHRQKGFFNFFLPFF